LDSAPPRVEDPHRSHIAQHEPRSHNTQPDGLVGLPPARSRHEICAVRTVRTSCCRKRAGRTLDHLVYSTVDRREVGDNRLSAASLVSDVLRVDRLETGDRRLVRDLVIDLGAAMDEAVGYPGFTGSTRGATLVTVPQGFETDFSSVPPPARVLYRFDSVDLAGCCHDLAYRVGVPRRAADEIWRIVATSGERRVSPFRGRLGWLGLRVGGWLAYKPTGDPMKRPS
jgi:hypothetical protein